MIDNLHLFLRVADVLINLLITELKRQDAIDKKKSFTSFNAEKYCHIFGFQKFVTRLGIPDFQFYIGKTSKQLKCRTLTGPEKCKVFQNIKITEMLPNSSIEEACRIQHLWDELLSLNETFSKPPGDLSDQVATFVEKARQWRFYFNIPKFECHTLYPCINEPRS